MILWLLLAAQVERPPFFTALERWECTFPAYEGSGNVTVRIGAFRSHAEDDMGQSSTIVQNDAAALVTVFSDYGNTDVAGKTRRWTRIDVIDKRTKRFKRTILDIEEQPSERAGLCSPY